MKYFYAVHITGCLCAACSETRLAVIALIGDSRHELLATFAG
jgi:sulfite reductase beta subunit-like hemoprotein